jgi:hypothetical protein
MNRPLNSNLPSEAAAYGKNETETDLRGNWEVYLQIIRVQNYMIASGGNY